MAKQSRNVGRHFAFGGILVASLLVAFMIGYFWTAWFPTLIPTRQSAVAPSTQSAVGVGEQFEVLTAIFTLAAFVGVLITLWYQRQDLELQREEAFAQRVQAS